MLTIEALKRETATPVVLADHEGFIRYVNARFQEAFGWSEKELLGRPLTTIIPTSMQDAHHLGFSRFLSTGKPTLLNRPLKLKVLTRSGREVEAEHHIIAENQNGHWVFGAKIRPL